MIRLTSRFTPLLLAGLMACNTEQPVAAPATPTSPAAKAPRLEGEVHVAGRRKRVLPFILHDPGMDLRVQCLARRDGLAKEGKTVPLCFDERERAFEKTVTTIRVEHHEGLRMGQALHVLRSEDEAVHFVVDDGGAPYQTLDLALSARRLGVYQPTEVRILSGQAEGHERLVAALKTLYPSLGLEVVPAKRPERSDTAAPSTPKGAPAAHKEAPGAHKEAPGAHKEAPGAHKEAPVAPRAPVSPKAPAAP